MEYTVCITVADREDGRTNVNLSTPPEQPKLTISEMAKILSGGISLCVGLCEKEGLVKDYELMQEIIDYLNNEFISLDSFKDGKIIKD